MVSSDPGDENLRPRARAEWDMPVIGGSGGEPPSPRTPQDRTDATEGSVPGAEQRGGTNSASSRAGAVTPGSGGTPDAPPPATPDSLPSAPVAGKSAKPNRTPAVLGLAGALLLVMMISGNSDDVELTVSDPAGPSPVVELDGGSADVEIRAASGNQFRLESSEGEVCFAQQTSDRDDISADCSGADRYVLTVPEGVTLNLDSGSGSVDVQGTYASASLEAGSGDLRFRGQADRLELESGSGGIDLELNGAVRNGRAEAGSGNISVRGVPENMRVETDSGSGNVKVPAQSGDGNAGRLMLETGSGNIDVRE